MSRVQREKTAGVQSDTGSTEKHFNPAALNMGAMGAVFDLAVGPQIV